METMTNQEHPENDFAASRSIFDEQDPMVRRFIDTQAKQIAFDLIGTKTKINFSLPDKVLTHTQTFEHPIIVQIPDNERARSVQARWKFGQTETLKSALDSHLRSLEQSSDPALATCGSLFRFAIALNLVTNVLPDGRSVIYRSIEDESIPSIPELSNSPESAITQASDAIAQDGGSDPSRGTLQTPFTPDARRFFLPQWVAFSLDQKMIANDRAEAEAMINSMRNYVEVLHKASSLAPYIVHCADYQKKRYGILGQLVNQGRALAAYLTAEIITGIDSRASSNNLNRGLSISLPFFNDQALAMETADFQVIPGGRIMFIPAFVVRAVRGEIVKTQQDTRLNTSTSKHLIQLLERVQTHFESK